MFEKELKYMIKYFANKERIDYYKRTFKLKTTKDVLVFDYGNGHFGSSGHIDRMSVRCNPKYMAIKDHETDNEQFYGWEWIASQVDMIIDGKGFEQMSLF